MDEIKLGFNNILKNKGATCISFEIQNTKLIFINAHLEHSVDKEDRRNESLEMLLSKFYQIKHQVCFLSGDLN